MTPVPLPPPDFTPPPSPADDVDSSFGPPALPAQALSKDDGNDLFGDNVGASEPAAVVGGHGVVEAPKPEDAALDVHYNNLWCKH